MALRIAIQMDPLEDVDINADTSFALAETAQARRTPGRLIPVRRTYRPPRPAQNRHSWSDDPRGGTNRSVRIGGASDFNPRRFMATAKRCATISA